MADPTGLDWPDYLRSLNENGVRALAMWLVAEGLDASEFMEVVDRAYAIAPEASRQESRSFVTQRGRPVAALYARRKHRFAGLAAALEQARVSGALPGDVALNELRPLAAPSLHARSVAELIAVLERGRRKEQ